jgi:hypothetical protein
VLVQSPVSVSAAPPDLRINHRVLDRKTGFAPNQVRLNSATAALNQRIAPFRQQSLMPASDSLNINKRTPERTPKELSRNNFSVTEAAFPFSEPLTAHSPNGNTASVAGFLIINVMPRCILKRIEGSHLI